MVTIQAQSKQYSNIQAIVFDKDGTLSNTESYLIQLGQKRSRLIDAQVPGVQEPIQLAFGLEGNQLNPMGMLAIASRHESEIAAAAYIAETGKPWMESLDLAKNAFEEAAQYLHPKCHNTPLLSGTFEQLQTLARAPIKLAVLSSDTTDNVAAFIDYHHLSDFITVGRGVETGLTKPNPQVFWNLCQELDVAPEQTLMVGDSAADMQMAKAAQAAGCIGVNWGWSTPVQLPMADIVLDHWQDLRVSD